MRTLLCMVLLGCAALGQTVSSIGYNVYGTQYINAVPATVSQRSNTPTPLPDNGLARTPPMGWSSWFTYEYNVTEQNIKDNTDALVSSGLAAAGYQYVVIDEGWPKFRGRSSNGNIVADPTKFPDGIPYLSSYIHGQGLKVGIYGSNGTDTCVNLVGAFGYEQQDANLYATWGVDLYRQDFCSGNAMFAEAITAWGNSVVQYSYEIMGRALQASGRPMVYMILDIGNHGSPSWGRFAGGNTTRISGDVYPTWASFSGLFDVLSTNAQYASPGHWNDCDILGVGNTGTWANGTMTDTEGQTQFSLYAIAAAPLLAGNNLAAGMSAATLATLTNMDVIAVDQDSLGIAGVRVSHTVCGSSYCDVFARQLSGGACAIGLFNRSTTVQNITATFATIAATVPACGSGPYTTTRDLWAHASLGTLTTSYTATAVPTHGVFMMRVAP